MARPVVAIVGRPNVGKSTLFNRLLGRRQAIVEDTPGITRDRIYAPCRIGERECILVDTGGLIPDAREGLEAETRLQSEAAIQEADVLLFVLDGREPLTALDQEIHERLRQLKKPVLYVVNKVDGPRVAAGLGEFYALGVKDLYPISAEHGLGVEALVEALEALLPETPPEPLPEGPRVAVVGRPNVGKSTLINQILGTHRLVTSPQPGTTRDAVDTWVTREGKTYCFVDTAGIRRRSRVAWGGEAFSVFRALRSIERADVVLLVLEGPEGVTDQDARIARYVLEAGRALLFVVNKWDLVEKDASTADRYRQLLRQHYPTLAHIPMCFVSALTGRNLDQLFVWIQRLTDALHRRIGTGLFNRFLREALSRVVLTTRGGKPFRVYYGTQVGVAPPTFVLFCNRPEDVPETLERYLERRIRHHWHLEGVPIRLQWRPRR